MSNFTIDDKKAKLQTDNRIRKLSSKLRPPVHCLLLLAVLFLPVAAQQHTDNNRDQALRGSGRVNPSTLGLEIEIPLGKYPGRGIDIPVTMSYSSKLWRTEFVDSQPQSNNPGSCIQINTLEYGDLNAAGWTSSLSAPYIEYTGADNLFDENGKPLSMSCIEYGNEPPPELDAAYVRRITVHLPSGESHELRADDTVTTYPRNTPQPVIDFNGTFYAVDGSNIKYIENSVTGTYKLQMPDGSFYVFAGSKEPLSDQNPKAVRKAHRFEDKNGNYATYDNGAGSLTDTLGRELVSPVPFSAPDLPTSATSPKVLNLPGLNGSFLTYKFHWKRLNGGSQDESALTDITDPQYQLRYKADRPSTNPHGSRRPEGTYLFESQWESWVHDSGDQLFNPVVLTEIELPTGASYGFSYDIYGRIERVRYPAGGEERFDYQEIPGLTATPADDISNQTNFGVVSRKVYADPQNSVPYVWTYSAVHVAPSGYKVTVVSPENIKTERLLYRNNDPDSGSSHGRFGYDNVLSGMSYEDLVYDKNNVLVNRSRTFWTKTEHAIGNAPDVTQKAEWHPRISQTEKYVYDAATGVGVRSVTAFGYESESELNEIETPVLRNRTLEYGYENAGYASSAAQFGDLPDQVPPSPDTPVTGSLVRSTQVTFLVNDPAIPESTRAIYKNRNLIGLVTVSELRDSAGSIISRSENLYDQPGSSNGNGLGNTTESRMWDSSKGTPVENDAYVSARTSYDQYGNAVSTTDAVGNVLYTEYDLENNTYPVRITGPAADADGSNGSASAFVQTSEYDSSTGLLLSTKNENGLETFFEFDAATLRLHRTSQRQNGTPVGSVTEIEFGDEALASWIKTRKQIDPDSWQESTSHFDGLGRGVRTERVHTDGNIVVNIQFDSEGRVSRVSSPYRNGETRRWTTNEYDDAGRVTKVTGPDGTSIRIDFGVLVSDRSGTTKTVTDQAGRSRTGIMDALGRMVRVIEDPQDEALETDYIFDADSRIRETVQGVQHRYFKFDSLGRLTYSKQPEQEPNPDLTATDPVTGNTNWAYRFEYDDNGNTVKTTDPRSVAMLAEYDSLNRITKRTYSDATPEVSYYYDGTGLEEIPASANGKLTKVSSSVSETLNTEFDELGRISLHEQRTGGRTYQTRYEYNLLGQLVAEVYPSQRRVNYERNSDGELETVRGLKSGNSGSTVYLNEIERNTAGHVTGLRLGNGRWGFSEYNDRDQLVKTGLGFSRDDDGVLNLTFEYGGSENNGSLTSQKIGFDGLSNEITQNYVYDSLNRISSSSEYVSSAVQWRETFQYDRYGNREFDLGSTSTVPSPDKVTNPAIEGASNRMRQDQDGDSVLDYLYDKAGNLVLDAENKRFVYDAENRITSFFRPSNSSNNPDAVYEYDGDGRRVRKLKDGNETVFVYNALGKLVAEYSDKLPETPQIGYLTKDHLGSTRVVTDGSGTVVSRNDFMAFGEDLTVKVGNISGRSASHGYGAGSGIRKQYTGYERDGESGLDFAQARYYNAAHARYTSADPLTASADLRNPQTFNRYSYVLNSPHKFVDPLGLISQSTAACGQLCYKPVLGSTTVGDISTPLGTPMAYSVDEAYSEKAVEAATSGSKPEATEPPEPAVDDSRFKKKWGTYNNNGAITEVSEEVDKVLDDALRDIANNIMTAMGAVRNLEDHPETSSSVSFTIGAEADVGGAGGASGGVRGSATVSANFDSPDAIERAVKDANDRIQIATVAKLSAMSSPTSLYPDGINLGTAETLGPFPDLASSFGDLVRRTANDVARAEFNRNFANRKYFLTRQSYPSQFENDH